MNRKVKIAALLSVFITAGAMAQTLHNVSGTVLLEDQIGTANHAGVKIAFYNLPDLTPEDSTVSQANGSYSINISPGYYLVEWTLSGYVPWELGGLSLASNTVLDSVILIPGQVLEVAGAVSGSWTTSFVYYVTDSIWVPAGDSLTINPGVRVKFDAATGLDCYGKLKVPGTESEPVLFTSRQPTPGPGDWRNVALYSPYNRIEYLTYEWATDGIYGENAAYTTIDHLTINGSLSLSANGLYFQNSDHLTLTNNTIAVAGSYGIFADNSTWSVLNDNTIVTPQNGIRAFYAHHTEIGHNVIKTDDNATGPAQGIDANYSQHIAIHDNRVIADQYGIRVNEGTAASLERNRVTGRIYWQGVSFQNTDSSWVYRNYVQRTASNGNDWSWQYLLNGDNSPGSVIRKDTLICVDLPDWYADNMALRCEQALVDSNVIQFRFSYYDNYAIHDDANSNIRDNELQISSNANGTLHIIQSYKNSNVTTFIENNRITYDYLGNSRFQYAIRTQSNTIVRNNTITADQLERAIYVENNCVVDSNTIDGDFSSQGAIYIAGDSVSVQDNELTNRGSGTSIYAQGGSDGLEISNNTFRNTAGAQWLAFDNSDARVHHNTVALAGGNGFEIFNQSAGAVYNNTLVNLTGGQIGGYIYNQTNIPVYNNVLQGFTTGINAQNSIQNYGLDHNAFWEVNTLFNGTAIPPLAGQIIDENANGDPADIYGNIRLAPRFTDPANGDFTLQASSPLINAGRGTLTDPDGTPADMGAFYHHIWVVLEHTPLTSTIDTTGPYAVNARVFTTQGVTVAATLHYSVDGGNTYQSVPMTNTVADTFYAEIPGQSLNTTVQYYLAGTDSIHTAYAPKNYTTNPYSFYVTLFGQFANLGGSSDVDGVINLAWTTPAPLEGELTALKLYRSIASNVAIEPENLYQTFDAIATTYLDTLVEEGVTYSYRLTGLVALDGDTLESLVSDEIHVLSDDAGIVRVRGTALLADAADHTDIKVYFEKSSPSAASDSAYTNADGFYDQILKTGIYNVHFSHPGYQPRLLGHQFYSANTWVDTLTLVPGGEVHLAGTLADTLFSNNLYLVDGHVTVPAGETLTIQAGTQVLFTGNYDFTCNGRLMVAGTPDQKVLFGSRTPQPAAGDWGRITLSGYGASGSEIRHAIYKHGSNGLYLSNLDTVTIEGVEINSLPINSTAITLNQVNRFTIRNNTLSTVGDWVVKKTGDYQTSQNSVFSDNVILGSTNGVYLPRLVNGLVSGNRVVTGGTGIDIHYSSQGTRVAQNRITGNNLATGLYMYNSSNLTVEDNYVENAHTFYYHEGTTQSLFARDSCVLTQPFSYVHGFQGGSQNAFTDIYISMTPVNGDESHWYGFYNMQTCEFTRIRAEIRHQNSGYASIYQEVHYSQILDSYFNLRARYGSDFYRSAVQGNGNTLLRDTLIIDDNSSGVYGSNLTLKDVIIHSPEGNNNHWAVQCTGGVLNMDHVQIETTHGVTASGSGGVIRNSEIRVLNSGNDALQLLDNSTFTLYQNTLVGNNSRYGVWSTNNTTVVTNSTIITGFQTAIQADAPNTIQTSLLHNNGTHFAGSAIPQETGSVVTVNANDDPSDIYGNIFLNPLFVDAANGDFHLQAASPAVNAGDIDSLDLDGTVADIGAYFYNFGVAPYDLALAGTDEESITVVWDMLPSDSIVAFLPYYRLAGSDTWLFADSTGDLSFTYTGLVNNQDYELAVSCRYPGHETGRSAAVIARPGVAELRFNPSALVRYLAPGEVPAVTFAVTNLGTKTGSFTIPNATQISQDSGAVAPGGSLSVTDTLNLGYEDYWAARTVWLYDAGVENRLDSLAVLFGREEYRALDGSQFGAVPASPDSFTVVITDARLDGESLQIGDEIAVYDVGDLVGSAQVAWGFPIFITCYGTTPGDPLDFVIWDMSQDELIEPQYYRSAGAAVYETNSFTVGSLGGSAYRNISIPLQPQRFNLISVNAYPRYTFAETFFSSVDSLAIVYNDLGQALIPQFGINSLGNVNITRGYHVFSYAQSPTVDIQGLNIHPENYPVTVRAQQFNSIAYLGQSALPVAVALSEIDTLIDIVQDDAGGVYIPDLGVNTLQNMVPEQGYQIFINADSDVSFTYPDTTVVLAKASKPRPQPLPATKFRPVAASGLPYTIVVQSLEVDGHDLSGPGEIGIYDGNLCVGAVRFTEWPAVVTTWQGSDEYGVAGFTPGHAITFSVWMDELAQTIAAQHDSEIMFGDAPYGLARLTSRPGIIPETFYLEQNYPNPFNPSTHIRYGLPETETVSLVIYNITGREVWRHTAGVQKPGKYEVIWPGTDNRGHQAASGIYLYRLQAGKFSAIKKMTLIH